MNGFSHDEQKAGGPGARLTLREFIQQASDEATRVARLLAQGPADGRRTAPVVVRCDGRPRDGSRGASVPGIR